METHSSIPELNADCLMQIFSYLPIADRIRVQRVCKHWHEVGNLPWRDMNTLDFYWSNWTEPQNLQNVSRKILRQVIKLCGSYLRKIELSDDGPVLSVVVNEAFIALLKEYCPNLQILSLGTLPNRNKVLKFFAKYFDSITEFYIGRNYCDISGNKDLERFFRRNRNLRSVTIELVDLQGRCLRYLPFENIEKLRIISCNIEDFTFHTVIQHLPQLKIFEFTDNGCQNVNDLLHSIIVKSNLKKLSAFDKYENLNDQTITHLCHLEKLKLYGALLHDDLLIRVSRNCTSLTKVTLGSSEQITDASLVLVLGLPNLQYVKLTKLTMITNNSLLTRMPKLKSLKCESIPLLENSGLRAVMESSNNIEYLLLIKCDKVSKQTLIGDALRITENRNTRLRIRIIGPQENGEQILDTRVINASPNLQIL